VPTENWSEGVVKKGRLLRPGARGREEKGREKGKEGKRDGTVEENEKESTQRDQSRGLLTDLI